MADPATLLASNSWFIQDPLTVLFIFRTLNNMYSKPAPAQSDTCSCMIKVCVHDNIWNVVRFNVFCVVQVWTRLSSPECRCSPGPVFSSGSRRWCEDVLQWRNCKREEELTDAEQTAGRHRRSVLVLTDGRITNLFLKYQHRAQVKDTATCVELTSRSLRLFCIFHLQENKQDLNMKR